MLTLSGLNLLLPKLATIVHKLAQFSLAYKDMPTLGYTHYQPAQLITVGRRSTQWIQDLLMDLEDIERVRDDLKVRLYGSFSEFDLSNMESSSVVLKVLLVRKLRSWPSSTTMVRRLMH